MNMSYDCLRPDVLSTNTCIAEKSSIEKQLFALGLFLCGLSLISFCK